MQAIARRSFLVGAAALPVVASLPRAAAAQTAASNTPALPPSGRIAFAIERKGSVVGSHVLAFASQPDGFDIKITVRILIKLGPIPVFRYELDGTEQWRGGQVVRAEAKTHDDGTDEWMRAERGPEGIWVTGSKAERYLAPRDALPATHWNQSELAGPWINPQDGKLFRPTVAPLGIGPVPDAAGRNFEAERYDLTGEVQMQLWYAGRQWSGLLFNAKDGSVVRYLRT